MPELLKNAYLPHFTLASAYVVRNFPSSLTLCEPEPHYSLAYLLQKEKDIQLTTPFYDDLDSISSF
jgi:hypothetical protein